MKLRNLLWSTLLASFICIPFTSCNNEENLPNDDGTKVELPGKRAYILYEGDWNAPNSAGIAFYAPNKDAEFISDLYNVQNSKKLGSTANAMVRYNGHIYIVVSDSKRISMVNEACVEVKSHQFTEEEGSPRQITAHNGFIYVSQWGGKVSKFKAEDLTLCEEFFKGGDNLEGITICNNKLYVADSYKNDGGFSYNKRIFEINPETMEKVNEYEVGTNPERLLTLNNKIYIYAKGDYADIKGSLQELDLKSGKAKDITQISKMALGKKDMLYLVNAGDITLNPTTPQNKFFQYNTKNGEVVNESFLKNAPKELESANIYLVAVDDETGEIYVGTADYTTTGTIYRFNEDGTFKEEFDAGGVNPNTMIFVD